LKRYQLLPPLLKAMLLPPLLKAMLLHLLQPLPVAMIRRTKRSKLALALTYG
jgi:hypothetical protein